MRKNLIVIIALVVVLVVPLQSVVAVDYLPLAVCGLKDQPKDADGKRIGDLSIDYTKACATCDFYRVVKNGADFGLYMLLPSLLILFLVIGGLLMIFGAIVNDSWRLKGLRIIKNTIIGALVALMAWLLLTTLAKLLAPSQSDAPWHILKCENLENLIFIPKELAERKFLFSFGKLPPPEENTAPATPRIFTSAPSSGTIQVCTDNSYFSAWGPNYLSTYCNKYDPALQQHSSNIVSAQLMKAIMMGESSCRPEARSPVGACGLMQIMPSTATGMSPQVKQKCGAPTRVSCSWLTQSPQGSICLASAYLHSAAPVCKNDPLQMAMGYNGGPGVCHGSRIYPETRDYREKIRLTMCKEN